jgi:Tol biopolymer transport system component
LTFDPANDGHPLWSPSGESIVFASRRDGDGSLRWERSDGSVKAQPLTHSPNDQWPWSWHPDGHHLAINEITPEGPWDIRILELAGDDRSGWKAGETSDFQATQADEWNASFSPDGRWLAYVSNASGQYQVFVRSFPDGGGKKLISIEGLDSFGPVWSKTNQELIFATSEISGSREWQIFAAKYSVDEGAFKPERPVRWQDGTASQFNNKTFCDLHPDGERLLVRRLAGVNDAEQIVDRVVLFENFFDYVREQLSTSEN